MTASTDLCNLFAQRSSWPCGHDGYDIDQLIDDTQVIFWYNSLCIRGEINVPRINTYPKSIDRILEEENDDPKRLNYRFSQKRTTPMATVQRNSASPPAKAVPAAVKAATAAFTLPTKPREPIYDLNRHILLVIGPAGIGKTTLCTQVDGVFVLSFDPLRETLPVIQEHVPTWAAFIGWIDALSAAAAAGKLPYKRIVLDGLDICFRLCQDFVCEELGVEHPTDAAYGKGWDRLNTEFGRAIDRFLGLPGVGKWFVCHSADKEIQKRDGRKVQATIPALKGGAERVVVGKCDVILNVQYEGEERVCTVRGDETIVAKACVDGRFLTLKGAQIHEIVLGNVGPADAYQRLVAAYENKQWYSTFESYRKHQEAEAAKKAVAVPAK